MAQLQDTTFRFTDSNVTSFVVKPYTANGPSSPSTSALYSNPDGVSAVSANTSLVLVGRGTPFYGEVVQRNLVYLLENFSNSTRPKFPTIGQIWFKKIDYVDPAFPNDPTIKGLYIWTGATWDSILMRTVDSSTGQLDLSSNRIINVGNAVNPTDALNVQTGDSLYLRRTGGFVTGDLTLDNAARLVAQSGCKVHLIDPPSEDIDAVNLAYVTTVHNVVQAEIDTTNARIDAQSTVIDGLLLSQTNTFASDVTIQPTATIVVQSGGAALSFGGRQLSFIADTPVSDNDAASKKYVDTSLSTITGNFASPTDLSTLHTQISTETDATYLRLDGGQVVGNLSVSSTGDFALSSGGNAYFGSRRLQNVGYPIQAGDGATRQYVDTTVATTVSRPIFCAMYPNPGSTITLPSHVRYTAGAGKIHVYFNAARMPASQRATDMLMFSNVGGLTPTSDTGLTAGTVHTWQITIDSVAKTLSITTVGTTSYAALIALLNANAIFQTFAVTFALRQVSPTELAIVAVHTSASAGQIALGINNLFSMTGTTGSRTGVELVDLVDPAGSSFVPWTKPFTAGSFTERGIPGTLQSTIDLGFDTTGGTVEVVVFG